MSLFYRTVLAALGSIALASPVFAEGMPATTTDHSTMQSNQAVVTKVDLNKANAKELMAVKGISASKARAIVSYRKKHGDFKSTADLAKVKGFNKMNAERLKKMEDQLTVQ